MKTRKIVITGGPGTGKTSVISSLEEKGYQCLHEVSREVILEARKEGIEQLFLTEPLLFSEKLLQGRIRQHEEARESDTGLVFIDRGVPDVVAYMDYFGNEYPSIFEEAAAKYRYEQVFVLPPWKEIYVSDNERYETYEQAVLIHRHLLKAYRRAGYVPVEVPKCSVEERTSFILDHIS